MKAIFTKIHSYVELLKKYNTLQNDYEILKELVKEDAFEKMLSNADKDLKIIKLEKENKSLRKKLKTLKEIMKNGEI